LDSVINKGACGSDAFIATCGVFSRDEGIAPTEDHKKRNVIFNRILRNGNEIRPATEAGFLFMFKARKQAHGKPCNCLRNAEDGRKDKSVAGIIKFTFLNYKYREAFGGFAVNKNKMD
jgi:hypothetical protein